MAKNYILNIKDTNGNWVPLQTLVGPKGEAPSDEKLKQLMQQYWDEHLVYLTIDEYNRLTTKDPSKFYCIVSR